MKIIKYYNCTQDRIDSKEYNIFIGISLGNKYFSKEHLREYLLWALEFTKGSVLFVIADANHAVNYEVFNKFSPEKALRHALRDGDKVIRIIDEIVGSLSDENKARVNVARWNELRDNNYYRVKRQIIQSEYNSNPEFHDYIQKVVNNNLGDRAAALNSEQMDKLAEYVLDEIPVMINSIEFKGTVYNLYPYPSSGLFDELFFGLQTKNIFSGLADRLEIRRPCSEIIAS